MWFREYMDYPENSPVIQEKVESGKGICGCEMHEIQGWGDQHVVTPLLIPDESKDL